MARITQVSDNAATPEAATLFTAIQGKIGMVPNLYRVAANQPAVLGGLLGRSGHLDGLGDGVGERLLAQDVQPCFEGVHRQAMMAVVGGRDHDGVELGLDPDALLTVRAEWRLGTATFSARIRGVQAGTDCLLSLVNEDPALPLPTGGDGK